MISEKCNHDDCLRDGSMPNCWSSKPHVLIHFFDGKEIVHYPFKDKTLCGDDEAGDKEWDECQRTNKPVDCKNCLSIVEYCKTLI